MFITVPKLEKHAMALKSIQFSDFMYTFITFPRLEKHAIPLTIATF